MRHYLKSLIITAGSFYLAYSFIPAIKLGHDPKNILIIIAGLWVISHVINPIFSLVLLPINLLTFGLLSLIINIAFTFAVINFLPGFSISAYTFPGANVQGIILPAIAFNSLSTIILVATVITFSQRILHVIFE